MSCNPSNKETTCLVHIQQNSFVGKLIGSLPKITISTFEAERVKKYHFNEKRPWLARLLQKLNETYLYFEVWLEFYRVVKVHKGITWGTERMRILLLEIREFFVLPTVT